jgi:hypothetical protein
MPIYILQTLFENTEPEIICVNSVFINTNKIVLDTNIDMICFYINDILISKIKANDIYIFKNESYFDCKFIEKL